MFAGDILEGTIRVGMMISVTFNSDVKIPLAIHSIEFVRKSGGNNVALCIQCDDPEEAELLKGLCLENEMLEISSS